MSAEVSLPPPDNLFKVDRMLVEWVFCPGRETCETFISTKLLPTVTIRWDISISVIEQGDRAEGKLTVLRDSLQGVVLSSRETEPAVSDTTSLPLRQAVMQK